ncbi:MAG: hypothetical protein AB1393_13520 [Candidatus Edwardsbacteria bacterium]
MYRKGLVGIMAFLVPVFVYAGGIVPHIRLNKSVYLVGEPIWVTSWVTNETDTTIRIMREFIENLYIVNSKGDRATRRGVHFTKVALPPYEEIWEIGPLKSSSIWIHDITEFYGYGSERAAMGGWFQSFSPDEYTVKYTVTSIPEIWQKNLWIFAVKNARELLELKKKYGYKQEDEGKGWHKRERYASEPVKFTVIRPTGEEKKVYELMLSAHDVKKPYETLRRYEHILNNYPNSAYAEVAFYEIIGVYETRFYWKAPQVPVEILRRKCYEFLERYPNSYFGIRVVSTIANMCGFSMEEKIVELERIGKKYKTEHIQYAVKKELKEQKEKLEQIKKGTYIGPEGPRYPRRKKE